MFLSINASALAICPSNGLNQKFRIINNNNQVKIILTNKLTDEELTNQILKKVNVDAEVSYIHNDEKYNESLSFHEYVEYLSNHYVNDIKIKPIPGTGGYARIHTFLQHKERPLD